MFFEPIFLSIKTLKACIGSDCRAITRQPLGLERQLNTFWKLLPGLTTYAKNKSIYNLTRLEKVGKGHKRLDKVKQGPKRSKERVREVCKSLRGGGLLSHQEPHYSSLFAPSQQGWGWVGAASYRGVIHN